MRQPDVKEDAPEDDLKRYFVERVLPMRRGLGEGVVSLEEDIMFIIEEEAMKYIKSKSKSVVIDMELQPSSGG